MTLQHSRPARVNRFPEQPLGVVFDLDGVIVDSFAVMRRAFDAAYAEVVGPGEAPFSAFRLHQGKFFPDIMRAMGLPLEMEAPFVRESYRLAHLVPVCPGVVAVLDELAARGVRCSVATGKAGDRARSLLQGLGLLGSFTHVVGSDEVARSKPAPDVVERALSLMDVSPSRALMVGDAANDVGSARAAGVTSAAALWTVSDTGPLLAAEPDLVLYKPSDLLAHCPTVAA